MHAMPSPPAIKRRLLAAALSLCPVVFSGWAVAAPEADVSLKDIPMPAAVSAAAKGSASEACPPNATMPTPAEMQVLARNGQDRGLLWRVRDGARTSWLYGTMHVSKRDWMMPGHHITGALLGADKLALELNVLDPEVGKQLAAGLKARDDAPELAAGLAARLALQRQQACRPELAKLRPEAQILGLMADVGRPYGLDALYGVDMMLAGMAASVRKPVIALETVQAQIQELVSDDPKEVNESVSDGLQQLEDGKAPQLINLMADLWAQGNEAQLENYADWCDCANTPRQRAQLKRLVDDRNAGMADGIVNLLKEGDTVFAAVGALHMVGPTGLPTLLRKKGYQVERVKFKPHTPPKTPGKPVTVK